MKIPPGFLHENLQLIMEKNEKCVIVFTSTVCYLDRMAYNTSFTCDSKHTFEREKTNIFTESNSIHFDYISR